LDSRRSERRWRGLEREFCFALDGGRGFLVPSLVGLTRYLPRYEIKIKFHLVYVSCVHVLFLS
jgi:hypothetical protein